MLPQLKGETNMIYKKIQLDKNDESIFLEIFAAEKAGDYIRDAILVIPGGGYGCVCADREGEPIAMAFMPYGYNAFVLHYSVGRKRPYPAQLIEASLAMKHIKDNAAEYNINPERVFVTGFSAGGHLAASLGTMWHRKEVYDATGMPYGYNKPTGIMPVYPVITANEYGHQASFKNLWCTDNPTKEQLDYTSAELHVDENSAPAFIMHTSNDVVVPVQNSLLFAEAYAKNKLLFELHIYPDAPHGVALGNEITGCGNTKWLNSSIAKWVEHAAEWAKSIKK